MINNNTHILLFDGTCNLCSGIVHYIIKKDTGGKFKFAALQSNTGQSFLKQFGLPADNFNSIVYINGDKYFLKSSAVLHVLKNLAGAWKLAYLFIILPPPLRDFIYNIIAEKRYKWFGKQNSCMMPTEDIKQRLLE